MKTLSGQPRQSLHSSKAAERLKTSDAGAQTPNRMTQLCDTSSTWVFVKTQRWACPRSGPQWTCKQRGTRAPPAQRDPNRHPDITHSFHPHCGIGYTSITVRSPQRCSEMARQGLSQPTNVRSQSPQGDLKMALAPLPHAGSRNTPVSLASLLTQRPTALPKKKKLL